MTFNKYSIEPLHHQACIFCYMAVQFGYMRMYLWLYMYAIATLDLT